MTSPKPTHPHNPIDLNGHASNSHSSEPSSNIILQGETLTASIRPFYYLTQEFTPQPPATAPGIDDDIGATDISNQDVGSSDLSDGESDDETIRGIPIPHFLPDSHDLNHDIPHHSYPGTENGISQDLIDEINDLISQDHTLPPTASEIPATIDEFNEMISQEEPFSTTMAAIPASTHGFAPPRGYLPNVSRSRSVNGFDLDGQYFPNPRHTHDVALQARSFPTTTTGFPTSFDGPTLQGSSYLPVPSAFNGEGGSTLIGDWAGVPTRSFGPTQPGRSMLLDDGQSRSAGFINATIQRYGGYGVPAFTALTVHFPSPMDDLEIHLINYPDLARPFSFATVALFLHDIYRQLGRFMQPDFPLYEDGYFWQYEQCFFMVNRLAQHIEDNDLRLRKYVTEIAWQVNAVGVILESENGHQELLDRALALIARLRAIAHHDMDAQLPQVGL